ncbi:glucoamylase family protein [Fimbriimonas ginsengisoli]|uniref:glucoamylase family protein n=1 Tax=Fimbriimonas ginsengisoli TaxID=1005039 RepID=UPI00130DF1E7|nr:glucoamylase family protein [Fimbriimonas ginsengisoli]
MFTSLILLSIAHPAPRASPAPLLEDLERRAVRFFWEQSNPVNGFSKDRATNAEGKDAHEVASCASVGFALVAYAIGAERGWIPRREALDRTRVTLRGLMTRWPNERGWLYHFIDYNKGTRIWNCEASSIDTSICLAGVLASQRYWKDRDVDRDANAFQKRIDWQWMLTDGGDKPDSRHFSMGWHPGEGFINARWNDFNECKMLYIQAYGSTSLPKDSWEKIKRTPVSYGGFDLFTGGPLFMHQMTESFYDFRNKRDRLGIDYGVETRNATLGNRQYCIDNPKKMAAYGPTFWGLSACDGPDGYNAFGAPGWVNDEGVVTPTSAVASMPFTPAESQAFAVAMRKDHTEAWGKYGFPNGYCPQRNWVGPDVIGIDLGMMMCGLENARSGFVWKLSNSHPVVQRGFRLAGLRPAKPDPRLRLP